MCGIVGSFNRDKLIDLSLKNSLRGNKAFSLTTINPKNSKVLNIIKQYGKFNPEILEQVDKYKSKNPYYILHNQSPTRIVSLSEKTIHPATTQRNMLWHNGMLLNETLEVLLKSKYVTEDHWDTQLMLNVLMVEGFNGLNNLQGSFGCIYSDGKEFYMFRNDIIPLYIDDDLNISSIKFESSRLIDANKVFRIRFNLNKIEEICTLDNKHNPYML